MLTRTLHLFALLLALVLAGQTFARSLPAVRVCKFTGKVMTGCPCPDPGPKGQRVERPDCCELRQSNAIPEPARESSPAPQLLRQTVALPAPSEFAFAPPLLFPTAVVPGDVDPAPRSRLFVRLRQLLI